MEVFLTNNRPIKAWVDGVKFDSNALDQIKNVASLPFIHKHVAVMPDVHAGIGATVGTVIATKGAVIPAAVGVDIGCGMIAVQLSVKGSQLPDNLAEIRSEVERSIPVGNSSHKSPTKFGSVRMRRLETDLDRILERHPALVAKSRDSIGARAWNQMGTLGDAKRWITVEEHIAATEGIECRKDEGVLDESPAAYKDIDAVMAAQADLVRPIHTLRQILCVKG